MLVWVDYVIFFLMLGFTIALGIYFGFCGSTKKTPSEYLLGNRAMTPIPIAMSLIATVISGIILVGVPTDVYKYGASFFWLLLAIPLFSVLSLYIYVPVFIKLESASVSQYLEIRFSRKIRILASAMFTMKIILLNPIIVYISSIALSFATGLNNTLIATMTCVICIFYTTIGGFKAVVWTDTIQTISIYTCMLIVICLGISPSGGFTSIWEKAVSNKRLDLFKSMLIFIIGYVLIMAWVIFCGLEIYAYYAECDPISNKQIKHYDQILPYFVQEITNNIPGLFGLFLAGVFSGTLSTLSTTLNSLSAIIYNDFLSGFIPEHYSDQKRNLILKVIVLIAGTICISMVFIIEHLGGIIALTISLSAIAGGPLLAVYTLGVVFPIANAKGAFYGAITGFMFSSWLVFGNQWYKLHGIIKEIPKPFLTDGCNSTINMTHVLSANIEEPFIMYRISYWYYSLLGAIPVIVVGLVVSWLTYDKDVEISPHLISPVFRFLLKKRKTQVTSEHLL
ncbi:hypothetical protein RN001_009413 [Aquatica leii]|uniref:Sodium-coupled monocarboxylate transporter 1 n=1 Tax=Aquatica leii TaxID=1421715 RepID=A0AAN7PVE2_9COLE|nr:hypothetical protein RN001_009413 [Aquatica leii]